MKNAKKAPKIQHLGENDPSPSPWVTHGRCDPGFMIREIPSTAFPHWLAAPTSEAFPGLDMKGKEEKKSPKKKKKKRRSRGGRGQLCREW